jgi:hypothetical protein
VAWSPPNACVSSFTACQKHDSGFSFSASPSALRHESAGLCSVRPARSAAAHGSGAQWHAQCVLHALASRAARAGRGTQLPDRRGAGRCCQQRVRRGMERGGVDRVLCARVTHLAGALSALASNLGSPPGANCESAASPMACASGGARSGAAYQRGGVRGGGCGSCGLVTAGVERARWLSSHERASPRARVQGPSPPSARAAAQAQRTPSQVPRSQASARSFWAWCARRSARARTANTRAPPLRVRPSGAARAARSGAGARGGPTHRAPFGTTCQLSNRRRRPITPPRR